MPPVSQQAASFCECGNHAFLAMKRGVTLTDGQDAHLLEGNALFVTGGYVRGKRIGSLHRAILGHSSPNTDHKSHDKLDNRRENLRACTEQQNQFNKKPNKRGRSAFKGVSWNSAYGRWVARISLNRQKRSLGVFADEQAAARAYDRAARETFGEFAYLNFPEEF